MNDATVLKCAKLAANQQQSYLGTVDQDIQDLIAELSAAPVAEPVAEEAPAIEEPVAEEVVEEPAAE